MGSPDDSAMPAKVPSPAGLRAAQAWGECEITGQDVTNLLWDALDAEPVPGTIDGFLAALPDELRADAVASVRQAAAADSINIKDYVWGHSVTPTRTRPESLAAAREWAARQ